MSKRKLSRQQRWRIEKVQAERASRVEKREAQIDGAIGEGTLGEEQQGLVVSHFGQQIEVENSARLRQRCHVRAQVEDLVTGDQVVWQAGNPTGVITARQARHSLLSRPDNHGKLKPVAANIDNIVIVIAPQPKAHANLIDRYLVAAEAINIRPTLLLNKTDLIDDGNRQELDALLQRYQSIGYKVVRASTTENDGLSTLKDLLKDRISVFVGQSGVGKSSLINVLLPGSDLRVGALSEATAKGRHTTTTARLFHFPSGGRLIDSPGIREFAMWNLGRDEILEGFVELQPYIGHCRFRDCHHEQEPGCALISAKEAGKISGERWFSYQQIIQSIE